jgi:hypothetical protein
MLLILNGHSMHEVKDVCEANNIRLLTLPPHLTHILQPLDVGIFNIYKAAIRNKTTARTVQWIADIPDMPEASRQRCVSIAMSLTAYRQAVTPHNIRQSFYKTGIYPPSLYTFLHFAEGLREVPQEVMRDAHEVVHNDELAMQQRKRTMRRFRIDRGIVMVGGGAKYLD